MKTKQLANVLLKMMGIYFVLLGIPSLCSGFLVGLFRVFTHPAPHFVFDYEWVYAVGGIIQLCVGAWFIINSRRFAERLFTAEDE